MRIAFALLLPVLCAGRAAAGVPADYLDEDATLGLAGYYKRAQHWALKSMVLLALGPRWHAAGAKTVATALSDRDPRVRAYAVEALLRTDADWLRRVASRGLVEALFKAQNVATNRYFGERARKALTRIAPYAAARNKTDWQRWWNLARGGYQPLPWRDPGPALPKGGRRTIAERFLRRLFDLNEAGLEVAICIDATGSMQSTIDAARDAVEDITRVLGAIAPEFRLALVVYRDDMDMPGGAAVLSPLTRNAARVRARLAAVQAAGGGDLRERVERGLALALQRSLGWQRRTNKLVIIVGDAPPKDTARAVEAAKRAHEHPFRATPVTGPRTNRTRPFVVSTIAVGGYPETMAEFGKIAAAGGGTATTLSTGRVPKGVSRGSAVVRHVLTLAFGSRWRDEVGLFLRIYHRYRREKAF